MTGRLCNSCEHFYRREHDDPGMGRCELMIDDNDVGYDDAYDTTRVYPYDYEGYSAGAHVGENFGCIHWKQKQ